VVQWRVHSELMVPFGFSTQDSVFGWRQVHSPWGPSQVQVVSSASHSPRMTQSMLAQALSAKQRRVRRSWHGGGNAVAGMVLKTPLDEKTLVLSMAHWTSWDVTARRGSIWKKASIWVVKVSKLSARLSCS